MTKSSTPLLLALGLLALTVGILHILGVDYFYYWRLPWLDWPVHFTAGAFVGMAAFVLLREKLVRQPAFRSVAQVAAIALAVGVLWELFEIYEGITSITDPGYVFDTGHDLLMDVLGGGAAGCAGLLFSKKGME